MLLRNIILSMIKDALFALFTLMMACAVVISGLVFFARLNPLFLAFVSEFEIVNESGQFIRVTPVGMMEGDGRYCPLGAYYLRLPDGEKKRHPHDIGLKAGESIKILYDMDDINFRHILIRNASSEIFIMDTDKRGNLHYCYGAEKDKYVIPALTHLSRASAELFPLINDKCVYYSGAREYYSDEDISTCNLPKIDTAPEKQH